MKKLAMLVNADPWGAPLIFVNLAPVLFSKVTQILVQCFWVHF